MATAAAGAYDHYDPFLPLGVRVLTPAAVPAATAAAAQTPILQPLTPITSFSEYLYSYSPISKLEILDSRLYPALNSTLHQLISTTVVPNPATPFQLATLIFITAISLLTFSAHFTGRRSMRGSSGGRRHPRKGKRRVTTTTLGKGASFRVQELYESNVLVAVADVPRGQPQHVCEDVNYNEYNEKPFTPKPSRLGKSPNVYGLVTKEKVLRAEDLKVKSDNGWFRDVKTWVLLLVRPPVRLLK